MTRSFVPFAVALLFAVPAMLAPAPAAAFDFPPVTDEEKALEDYSGAAAVILSENADFHFRDFVTEASSRLEVTTRMKILTPEGVSAGEVFIVHDGDLRLGRVVGRTVRADGTVVPLPEDAIFQERRSRNDDTYVTKLVFPQVEVGAILDYHYAFYWDSIFYLTPWYFQERLPKLHSRITYFKPDRMSVKVWSRKTTANEIDMDQQRTATGTRVIATMNNLARIPREPYAFPIEDLATRMLLYPVEANFGNGEITLMRDWWAVCDIFGDGYEDFRNNDADARKLAKSVKRASGSDRDTAQALYRRVRDQIRTDSYDDVFLDEGSEADEVLERGQGSDAEKALLLHLLLDEAGLDTELVWADDRSNGRAELSVPNPSFFDRVLVTVQLDGERVFLDPSDPTLAFGQVQPDYEGTGGLIFDSRDPEVVRLPQSAAGSNLRRARVDVEIDDEGRVHGQGVVELHGLAAWERIFPDRDPVEAWTERLQEAYPSFAVSGVEVTEHIDDARVDVRFALRQNDAAVLGDESSVAPAGVLALEQLFPQTPAERVSPVLMPFARRDELQWSLTYPPGWEIDVLPSSTEISGSEGHFRADYRPDVDARRIELERTFERVSSEILGKERYQALRLLYRVASDSDARTVELIRP